MPKQGIYRTIRISGLNTKVSPLLLKDGQCLQCVNYDPLYIGAKTKRQGYATFLDRIDQSEVKSLIYYQYGSDKFLLRLSGTSIYRYGFDGSTWGSAVETGLEEGLRMGHVQFDNTLCLGNGVDASLHTTDGESFTPTDGAPKAKYWTEWGRRVFAAGNETAPSTLFWSSAGEATNWSGTPPNDSSSIQIPGPGRINGIFTAQDKVFISKDSGLIYYWNGDELKKLSEVLAPTSYDSIVAVENSAFYLNRLGVYNFVTGIPQILSNPIESYIYNRAGNGIAGSVFDTAPGVVFRYKYLVSVGDITDCFGNTVTNAILVYDFQLNEWGVYSFANLPTAWVRYLDDEGNETLCFGDASGKCYTYGSGTDDAGTPIESMLEVYSDFGLPEHDKKFRTFWVFTNPGCEANISVYLTDSFVKERKNPISVGDVKEGVTDIPLPSQESKKYLFVKVSERSKTAPHTIFGWSVLMEQEGVN